MKTLRWLPLLALIAFLYGCVGTPTLLGKWTNTQPGGLPSMSYEFRDNGEFVQTQKTALGDRTMQGTWKLEGENLKLFYPTVSVPDDRNMDYLIRLKSKTLDFMNNGEPFLTFEKTAP